MKMLEDHVVLVTGGGSGLGRGVARHCLEQGAQLAIMEVSEEKVASLKQELGENVLILQGDVTKLADLEMVRAAIVERFHRLDALICSHGIIDGFIPLKQIDPHRIDALFDELFHVNVKGNFLAARTFVDLLEQSGGAIVLTASIAAYMADGGGAFYAASKGAVRSLVGQLAFEFAPRIRVNGVAPGGIANSQLRGPKALGLENHLQSDVPKDLFLNLFKSVSLLQELPTPEDHGPVYAFLASRLNKIMTGQMIIADQGSLNRHFITERTQAQA